jgi:hypothetical protein
MRTKTLYLAGLGIGADRAAVGQPVGDRKDPF